MRKKLVSILISMAMLGQMAVPAYASDSAAVSTESPAVVATEEAPLDSTEAYADSSAASADPASVPEIGGVES